MFVARLESFDLKWSHLVSLNFVAFGIMAHDGISCVPSTISSKAAFFLVSDASAVGFFGFAFFFPCTSVGFGRPLMFYDSCICFLSNFAVPGNAPAPHAKQATVLGFGSEASHLYVCSLPRDL